MYAYIHLSLYKNTHLLQGVVEAQEAEAEVAGQFGEPQLLVRVVAGGLLRVFCSCCWG